MRLHIILSLLVVSKLFFSCAGERAMESGDLSSAAVHGLHVPEGFVIEPATAPGMVAYPMFATLDDRGRLFVMESGGKTTSTKDVLENPTFQILLLEDENEDGIFEKRTVFADKIPYPMGGTFYRGSFYATAPPDLIRFTDTDDDGVADKREVLLTGWTLNHNAATLSGPFFGPDGWMYMCDARRGFDITTKEGTQLKGKGARIWRCRPDGTDLEWISGGGFDNTIELIFMPSGETIGTMTYFTDPSDGFRDALMHWVEGGVYPKPHAVIEEDGLKRTGDLMPVMTKLARVSPAGLMRYRSSAFGQDFVGNLFSAQFNTGRIMRHVIERDGGTFRTRDEVFMHSDSLDTHPTDVLEDADGSLLVVNTGGWFIAGCPLSVVAKTDIHGGIYRIRKTDGPEVEDPWGKAIDFTSLSVDTIIALLDDRRVAVRDHAVEALVLLGDEAAAPLAELLNSSESEETRTTAVFALYRINTPKAMAAVFSAFADKSEMVRTAAARVAGLDKDAEAVDGLIGMLQDGSGSVKRQASTALGQIGDARATGPLLEAAASNNDRFVEHAIIDALITLKNLEPVVAALKHPSENARNAALIALDQVSPSDVMKRDLTAFLNSGNQKLQSTGVRVLSRHADWTDVVIGYLSPKMNKESLSESEKQIAEELLITFAEDRTIQNFIASTLQGNVNDDVRTLLLDVIRRFPTPDLPQAMVQQLARLVKGSQPAVQSRVLDLVQSRSVPALNNTFEQLFNDPRKPLPLRLKALNARIMSKPELLGEEFDTLLKWMNDDAMLIRQTAVTAATRAALTNPQLMVLAKEVMPGAETFLLPGLVNAFEGNESEAVGVALVAALKVSPERLENLSLGDLQKLFGMFPAPVQQEARPLLQTVASQQATRLSTLEGYEKTLTTGDVGEGRKLFYGKALCSTCHSVVGKGGTLGPDLTNIGEIRSQHDLLEAILFPSASFAREYETTRIATKTASHTGIIREQMPETVVLETGPGVAVRIPRAEITSTEIQNISLMPPGIDKQLTTGEMSDLMAYLMSLPEGIFERPEGFERPER